MSSFTSQLTKSRSIFLTAIAASVAARLLKGGRNEVNIHITMGCQVNFCVLFKYGSDDGAPVEIENILIWAAIKEALFSQVS